ncbi:isopeptide-forming domain-containing fimbrial protein [Faecalibaculum rodentium]|uniref:isopeptide-forming domain-containing fimbrial protein n=1 Tax=Faecalibaculum rodentium TaxID=1702221 RepID=UPI0023F2019F|nr:isopeptide-forming domain-containing fimbrial protein [Faecalibaculum rodentium]
MKTNKLLAAGALALSMAMTPVASLLNAMPMTVMAAENTTHTITIDTNVENATYSAYQIFKGSTLPGGKDTNLANVTWGNGISEAGKTAVYAKYEVETAQEMANKLTSQAEARAFAAFINQYLQNPVDSTTSTTTDGKPVISVTGDGYYLIKDAANSSQAPTESILKVVNDVSVKPKTTNIPDTEKKVVENNKAVTGNPSVVPSETGHKINDVADYNIGDTVPFILAAKTPASTDIASYTNYVFTFHDKMDAGLTLDANSIVVKVGDDTLTAGTDYTLITNPNDNDTFDLVLNIKCETLIK